jgi:hypothetical protein
VVDFRQDGQAGLSAQEIRRSISQGFSFPKVADHFGWISMLAVDRFVHAAHIVRGDLSGQGIEGGLNLRPTF